MTEPYKVFFGQPNTKDKTIKENNDKMSTNQAVLKGWDEDWLRNQEFNNGGIGLGNPYAQHPIVNRAIRTIAENIPQAKYKVYFSKNDKEVPVTQPISKLFMNPNPFMSRFEFWEAIATWLNLAGEAMVYINQSIGGVVGTGAPPAELWVLNPREVKHVIDNGRLKGWIYSNNMPIEPSELLHFKLFNPNGIRGLSPLSPAKYELEADFSAGKWNKKFFDNNATPDSVIELDKESQATIDELRKLKRMWYENHGGTDNHGKTAFLLGGMKFKHMGINQREMDFINSRKLSRDSILAVFGVSPFVAGFYDSGTVTRATALAAKRLFWTGTLKPMLIRIEEKIMTNFFPNYAPDYYGKFDYSGVEELQEDLTDSLERAKKAFDLGWSINEVNEAYKLGLPEKDFSGFRPMNLVRYELDEKVEGSDFMVNEPSEQEKPTENSENEPEKEDKGYDNSQIKSYSDNFVRLQGGFEKVLRSKLKKFFYNQRVEILKILNDKKDITPEQMEILGKLGGIFDDSKEKIVEFVEPVYAESAQQAGELAYGYIGIDKEFIVNPKILNDRLNKIKGVNDTVYNELKKDLADGIAEGESISELSKRVRGFYNHLYNPSYQYLEKISRTETASLMNGTQFEIYKEEGINQIEWISEPDARESHQINGEVTTIGQPFSNSLLYPGDPSAGPEETINCRCTVSAVVK